MKNSEVIECFLNGTIGNSCNLFSTGDKLISYKTCIAEKYNNLLLINMSKYSSTTSAIQNRLFKKAPYGKRMWDIPKGTDKLSVIYEQKEGYIRFVQNRDYSTDSHLTFIPISKRNHLCNEKDIMMDKYGEAGKIRYGIAGAYNVALLKIKAKFVNFQKIFGR